MVSSSPVSVSASVALALCFGVFSSNVNALGHMVSPPAQGSPFTLTLDPETVEGFKGENWNNSPVENMQSFNNLRRKSKMFKPSLLTFVEHHTMVQETNCVPATKPFAFDAKKKAKFQWSDAEDGDAGINRHVRSTFLIFVFASDSDADPDPESDYFR
jgi:hypothetical protein